MADRIRVHNLAKELSVNSKIIVEKCQAEGLPVKNHMATLSAGLEATIREWFSEGAHVTTMETAKRVDLAKIRKRAKKKAATRVAQIANDPTDGASDSIETTAVATMETPEAAEPGDPSELSGGSAAATLEPASASADGASSTDALREAAGLGESVVDSKVAKSREERVSTGAAAVETGIKAPSVAERGVASAKVEEPVGPAGPQNVPRPAQLKGPRVVRYEAPEQNYGRPEMRRRPVSPPGTASPPGESTAESLEAARQRRGRVRAGATPESPQKSRTSRRYSGTEVANEKLKEWRDRDLLERQERITGATGRRIGAHRVSEKAGPTSPGTSMAQKTEASVQAPVIMKDLCAATGISMLQILPILRREFNVIGNVNMEISAEMAEYVALEHGITLTVMPAKTPLDEIREEYEAREPGELKQRPPVVTMLGHVDHGKTSLLDAIRATHVVDKEDGGITQHIGAYHLQHKTGGRLTFLDTPGHEAFTAMRARGAQMTDIVVLVVAADDGVMPQTIEAINHAKAAGVPVVVALNKIDLPGCDINKAFGQLSEQGLTPSGDWGGETDVLRTSTVTGEGIDELVEHLVALGEVLDLNADHKGGAMGTVIEAETKEGVGAVVRVLIQEGVLETGCIVVCGHAFGKVRALIDDRGKRLKQAGPSIPVEVWGLDEVPMAGDKLYEVKSMQRAKLVADGVRRFRTSEGRTESRRYRSLEDVFKRRDIGEIPELNVIIRADVDGSLDALRSMLERLPSGEVRLSVRHSGVGPVTDSDILLADASDAIVVAFRVITSPGAKKLADEKGVDIRPYKVVYEVLDDIRKAMEGMLEPEEKEEPRASCDVRDVFRISKLGVVAGCLVSNGVVHRNHIARLTRDGVVVRDRNRIGSLRRFKDDVKEVRAGMECGIRLDGYDDVKAGDVIETFEVVQHARKLSGN